MKWSDEYATGVERIDNQHKMIFKIVDNFRVALEEGRAEGVYETTLQSLEFYVRTHFGFEEQCMEDVHCPVAEINRKEHMRFVNVLFGYRQRHLATGFDPGDARDLPDTIEQWLANHICRIDIHLKQCVQNP